ncbi:hypothetical protein BT93_L1398 [Corymbia citriodora subsp. variegata]|uniref:Cytochrome P450 n=1 Tax=Corymbia citriodora subsp. variegata TaxID=360336 RepID=A0A8T0CRP4_CORYI|nr:hypothetical protein BT93_L1398 [Corymbia citriodora subsp. variegata]
MWVVSLCLAVATLLYYARWAYKWRNPRCSGVLPPGSMGLPLIGETLELLIPSYSLDLHPFIRKRMGLGFNPIVNITYGPIFRTSLIGQPIIISVDSKFNNHILQQEGRLVEIWYLDTIAKLFALEGESRLSRVGLVHKYIRRIFLNHFGSDILREKLLQQIEEGVERCLRKWSSQPCIEVKEAAFAMMFDFAGRQLFSFLAFPLNVPGTAYHRCLKEHRKFIDMLKDTLRERLNSGKTSNVDFLDEAIDSMHDQDFLTEDFMVQMMFVGIFASSETISSMLAMIFKLLSGTPAVLEELRGQSTALCWDEYKSMTFTMQVTQNPFTEIFISMPSMLQRRIMFRDVRVLFEKKLMVINETLRLANFAPWLLRRAVQDIPVNGFMIPKGWSIMAVTTALHTNHDVFENPLEFNPWRWKCVGAEYTRAFLCAFLHVSVTKFRWTEIKVGDVYRNYVLCFKDGIKIKILELGKSL